MKVRKNAFAAAISVLCVSGILATAEGTRATAQTAAVRPAAGEQSFRQRCQSCHSVAPTGASGPLGPNLRGVVGRKAGTGGFSTYSPALKKAQIVWTRESLDNFLAAPGRAVPGTRMVIAVTNPKDRTDLIAYLATQR